MHLVLPLLREAPWADNETSLEVSASDQLLDEQTGHDCFARSRIVGEEESQRLLRQHGFVDRRDLVRQRVHERCMHGEHRIEQMRQVDTVCLGDKAEQFSVAIETPRATVLDDLESRLVVAIENFIGHAAVGSTVDEGEGVRPVPMDADDSDAGVRQNAAKA